jgi:hypothetical protein
MDLAARILDKLRQSPLWSAQPILPVPPKRLAGSRGKTADGSRVVQRQAPPTTRQRLGGAGDSSMFIDEIYHVPGMVLKMGRTSVKGRESIIQSLPAYCAVFSPP